MTTLRDRVLFQMEKLGFSQKDLMEKAGFKNPAFISDLLRGHKSTVRGDNLASLAKALGTTEQFLLGKTDQSSADYTAHTPAPKTPKAPSIPEFDVKAGASYGGGTDSTEWVSNGVSDHKIKAEWGLPKPYIENELGLSFGFTDIIQIAGDSMDDGSRDALVSGDRVIIDRKNTDVRQGGIFAVWDGDGVIVKQVELIRGSETPVIICKSRNANYDPIHLVMDGNVRVIGRVAGKISRM